METVRLRSRSDLHIARKLWHSIGVLFLILVYQVTTWRMGVALLFLLTAFGAGLDIARGRSQRLNTFVLRLMGPLMRETERHGPAGTTYLFAGTLLIVLIFPKVVVTLTLLFLAFGDPVASYFGVLYGRDRIVGNKTLQGSLAGFFCCTLVAILFFLSQHLLTDRLLLVSLLAGAIGALAELIPLGKTDDNFTFPLIGASLLWIMFRVFGVV